MSVNFVWMIVDVLAEASTVVQVVHSTSMELGTQVVKEHHDAGVQGRKTLINVFFGSIFFSDGQIRLKNVEI